MTEVVYISDFFLSDLIGGGELNDHELCKELESRNVQVKKIRSHKLMANQITKKNFYIISNFINLNEKAKDKLKHDCNYVIYEHDHKYLTTRNPAIYNNYKAPKEHLINVGFYKSAKAVFCQSSFHEKIVNCNLSLSNTFNVSGNLWSKESLEIMEGLGKNEKKSRYSILNSRIGHKNTSETLNYCVAKGLEYELISSGNYYEFLSMFSKKIKFIFLPKTPETLSRVVVEAKMMNVGIVTNKRVGASFEPWFNMKGEDLILFMENKRQELVQKILEIIND